MWKLPAPNVDTASEELTTALTYANGTPVFALSAAQRQSVLELYETYTQRFGVPSEDLVAEELGENLLEAVKGAYDEVQEGRRLAALRDRLKVATRLCPYCGFGEVRDLDHHLPRSKYRGLAIHAMNLVPCCHPCNGKKRAIAGADPDAQFCHTYLDRVPKRIFLFADIEMFPNAMSVTFSVKKPRRFKQELFQRISFQFKRLELNERYQAEVNTFIVGQRTAIEDAYGNPGDSNSLKKFLKRAAVSAVHDFGLNDWRSALWRGLSKSRDFYSGGFTAAFGEPNPGA